MADGARPAKRPPPPGPPPPRPVGPNRLARQRSSPTARARPSKAAPLPTPPPVRTARRIKPRLHVVVLSLVVAALLGCAAILGVALWLETSLHRQSVLTDYSGRPPAAQGSNWLLVGSDSRQGLTVEQQEALSTGGDIGNGRTDTILVVHVPSVTSSTPTTMVSIPRDSYVPIPGYGRDKINAAFAMGGATLLVETVEQATGLHIDHYAEIGFGGFAAVVDGLGGVTVCPTRAIDDPLAGIDLPAGCQRLDGRAALGYVRSRATARADLDRMIDQRQFMSALLRRAVSPTVWLNPWRWYAVPHAAIGALTVDHGDHVWDLARLAWALQGNPTELTVPIGQLTTGSSGSVVVWDHDRAAALFDALAADQPVPASTLDEP